MDATIFLQHAHHVLRVAGAIGAVRHAQAIVHDDVAIHDAPGIGYARDVRVVRAREDIRDASAPEPRRVAERAQLGDPLSTHEPSLPRAEAAREPRAEERQARKGALSKSA